MDKRIDVVTPCVNGSELSIRNTINALHGIADNIGGCANDVRITQSSVLEPREPEKINAEPIPRDPRSCDTLFALEDLHSKLINIRNFLLDIMRDAQV